MKDGRSITSNTGGVPHPALPPPAPPPEGEAGEPVAPPALLERVDRFPAAPGVYLLKDARGKIIYIGKAVNLRSRVRSYFQKSSDTRVFAQFIQGRTADADCIVTASESEALILENNLIKKHRPTFNVRLKDDKT